MDFGKLPFTYSEIVSVPLFTSEEAHEDPLQEHHEEDKQRPKDGHISCKGLYHEPTNMYLNSIAELIYGQQAISAMHLLTKLATKLSPN